MPVFRLDDPRRLFASLSLEPERSAFLAAHLESFGIGDAAFAWRAGGATNVAFVAMIRGTPFGPTLIGYGFPAGMENLIHAVLPEIPDAVRIHFPAEDRAAIDRHLDVRAEPQLVTAVALAEVAREEHRVIPVALGAADAAEVGALVASRGGAPFSPGELSAGVHLGLREGGRLVALVSAPIVARSFRRAFVARLLAAPGRRGLANAVALHAALARKLLADGIEIAASQSPESDAEARGLAEALGYHAQYHALAGTARLRGARPRTAERLEIGGSPD